MLFTRLAPKWVRPCPSVLSQCREMVPKHSYFNSDPLPLPSKAAPFRILSSAGYCSSSPGCNDPVSEALLGLEQSDAQDHLDLLNQYQLQAMGQQNVFVIQPFLRNSSEFVGKGQVDYELKLAESLALVETMGWVAIDHATVGMDSYGKASFFGNGQIDNLLEQMKKHPHLTVIFISNYL